VSRRALHRIDPAAVAAVMSRDITLFRRFWPSTTFSSAVEPTIYLLAFGFGFGALVSRVDGIDYIAFVGTGIVATAVLYSSAFPGMFGAFVKRVFQRTYDAILATPVDPAELVTAEAVWIATRAGVYGCAPLLVALAFGLDPSPGMLLVPFVGFLTGFGFASFGIWVSGLVPTIDAFNYIVSTVLTPLFLVAGTFFPISALPDWAQTASW
jgi:lipooligosaccharide transport system permease protein